MSFIVDLCGSTGSWMRSMTRRAPLAGLMVDSKSFVVHLNHLWCTRIVDCAHYESHETNNVTLRIDRNLLKEWARIGKKRGMWRESNCEDNPESSPRARAFHAFNSSQFKTQAHSRAMQAYLMRNTRPVRPCVKMTTATSDRSKCMKSLHNLPRCNSSHA